MKNIIKRANEAINEYKLMRDTALEKGFIELETFYQILIVYELEKSNFNLYKKRDLKQHWDILHNLLSSVLKTNDMDYHMGIYYEVIYAVINNPLVEDQKIAKIIHKYFGRSYIQKYVYEAYKLHVNIILNLANKDLEDMQRYADNLLAILAMRYGAKSKEHARMKLHIMVECYFPRKKEAFTDAMKNDYEYLKQYTASNDSLFCFALLMYAYVLEERQDDDFKLWLSRCEDLVAQKCEDKNYCLLKSVIAWIKARKLVKENKKNTALKLLVQAIEKYITADSKNQNSFYAYVYLMAANICMEKEDKVQMYRYAQTGLEICEQLNQRGTELYYNLYNFIGVYYLMIKEWRIAEGFYTSSLDEIRKKFGKENENYFIFLNNLLLVTLAQGKYVDTYFYEFCNVKDENPDKYLKIEYINQLVYLMGVMPLRRIKKIYTRYVKYLGDEWESARIRLDTVFLAESIKQGILDEQTLGLLEHLEEHYKNCYTGDMAAAYWNSQVVWKWSKGDIHSALNIAKNIVIKIPIENYVDNILILLNYIQLLILNKKCDEAKKKIIDTINLLEVHIVAIGLGNIVDFLTHIRVLLSMYIYIIKVECNDISIQTDEIRLLLEKIVQCKTIDRELKGAFNRYRIKDDSMDFFYFTAAHRKLAALELRQNLSDLDTIQNYEQQKMKCILELGEYEAKVNEKIPFQELIQKFCLEDIHFPHDTVCLEYFAYYTFNPNAPIINIEDMDAAYGYFVFAIASNEDQSQIIGIKDIPIDDMFEKQVESLLEMTLADAVDENSTKIIQSLNHLLAEPIWEYIEKKEKVYVGIDFLLQSLPLDIIFCGRNGKTVNIVLVDSVRYLGEDTRINVTDANALIIGNSKTKIGGPESVQSLPCAEIECIEIAKMLKTRAYIGESAKQSLLWGDELNDIIHISVHGKVLEKWEDNLLKENILVNSYLAFAGCENWMSGNKEEDYGNGIVTSDDFQFMNLTNTKLVTLSCCLSGIGIARGLGHMYGLSWAIGVAGAENTISTLWEVDDCASAILMILFYRNLQHMDVSSALYEAKICLKNLTMKSLRKDDVLFKIYQKEHKDIGADDYQPYTHWKYWAGFVCQKG